MAVETFGGWGLESKAVFATLADRKPCHSNQAKPTSFTKDHFAKATCQSNDCQAAIVNCVLSFA